MSVVLKVEFKGSQASPEKRGLIYFQYMYIFTIMPFRSNIMSECLTVLVSGFHIPPVIGHPKYNSYRMCQFKRL